jgi:hypothetical protein
MSQESPQNEIKVEEDETIDGGEISQLKDPRDQSLIDGGEVKGVSDFEDFHERKHHVHTASKLGTLLVWMLGISFLLNLIGKIVLELYGFHEAAQSLSDDFKAWLPAITSLVASAVTYYFTRENNK